VDSAEERTKSHVLPDPGRARPRLLVFWDGGFVTRELPNDEPVIVGRSQECKVQIDHPSVSRRHVAVRAGDTIQIEDLGSSNGTRVGGVRIAANTPLTLLPGQIAEIGVAMLLVQKPPLLQVTPIAHPTERPPMWPERDEGPMQRLHRLVALVAASDLSVILLGETGVGKEVIAETIHRRSPRAGNAFIKLNCAALSESLLESELFGHERGAFTGAVRAKPGLVEAAEAGTLLLDEMGEMPLATQAKLLRVVETKEMTRLGSVVPRRVDVRFVAATNRDLEGLVASGAFRQDLYFRLNGITLTIPPLRERRDEIATLAQAFALQARPGAVPPVITKDALAALERYDWPGNVRELRSAIERAAVLSTGGVIGLEHISIGAAGQRPNPVVPPKSEAPFEHEREAIDRRLTELERQRIVEALERSAGNQTRAAKLLGMSRRTLATRLDELGLPRPRKGE
jgi:two-component system response regulator AtoC